MDDDLFAEDDDDGNQERQATPAEQKRLEKRISFKKSLFGFDELLVYVPANHDFHIYDIFGNKNNSADDRGNRKAEAQQITSNVLKALNVVRDLAGLWLDIEHETDLNNPNYVVDAYKYGWYNYHKYCSEKQSCPVSVIMFPMGGKFLFKTSSHDTSYNDFCLNEASKLWAREYKSNSKRNPRPCNRAVVQSYGGRKTRMEYIFIFFYFF